MTEFSTREQPNNQSWQPQVAMKGIGAVALLLNALVTPWQSKNVSINQRKQHCLMVMIS
jgi:hypothetical protein